MINEREKTDPSRMATLTIPLSDGVAGWERVPEIPDNRIASVDVALRISMVF